jgi:hypothetical protein
LTNYTIQTPSIALATTGAEWRPIITIREPTPPAQKPRRQASYAQHLERAVSTGRVVYRDYEKQCWRVIIRADDGTLFDLFPISSEAETHAINLSDIEIDG